MYITQETDYAIRIMYYLAKTTERKDARKISEEMCVTLRFSLKILGKLSSSGLVNSFKGNHGGYEIAKSPADISLRDILTITEGSFVFSRCLRDKNACNRDATAACIFHRGFADISMVVNKMLGEMTLQQAIDENFQHSVHIK